MAGGQQQAAGVEQIAMAMQNINQATLQSLASTRQAEKAAQDLNNWLITSMNSSRTGIFRFLNNMRSTFTYSSERIANEMLPYLVIKHLAAGLDWGC